MFSDETAHLPEVEKKMIIGNFLYLYPGSAFISYSHNSPYCMLEWNKITVKNVFLSHSTVLYQLSASVRRLMELAVLLSIKWNFIISASLTSRLFMRAWHCWQSINGAQTLRQSTDGRHCCSIRACAGPFNSYSTRCERRKITLSAQVIWNKNFFKAIFRAIFLL